MRAPILWWEISRRARERHHERGADPDRRGGCPPTRRHIQRGCRLRRVRDWEWHGVSSAPVPEHILLWLEVDYSAAAEARLLSGAIHR